MKYDAIRMPLPARFGVHLTENTMVAIIGTMSQYGLCNHVQMFAIKLSSRHFGPHASNPPLDQFTCRRPDLQLLRFSLTNRSRKKSRFRRNILIS
jgi:hypothetical protein